MKLQINSLAALERLIGGDTEVELEIRNNIVQEFAKKHLKPIADSPNINSIKADLLQQAITIVTAEIGTLSGQYWNQKVVLKKEVRDELVSTAKTTAQAAIQEAIMQGVAQARADVTPESIKARIDAQVKSTVDAEIKAGVSARLRAIAAGIS